MDEWITCDVASFSTAFRSYQDDGRMILKGCVQWNLVNDGKDPRLTRGLNSGPLDPQYASAYPTELLRLNIRREKSSPQGSFVLSSSSLPSSSASSFSFSISKKFR